MSARRIDEYDMTAECPFCWSADVVKFVRKRVTQNGSTSVEYITHDDEGLCLTCTDCGRDLALKLGRKIRDEFEDVYEGIEVVSRAFGRLFIKCKNEDCLASGPNVRTLEVRGKLTKDGSVIEEGKQRITCCLNPDCRQPMKQAIGISRKDGSKKEDKRESNRRPRVFEMVCENECEDVVDVLGVCHDDGTIRNPYDLDSQICCKTCDGQMRISFSKVPVIGSRGIDRERKRKAEEYAKRRLDLEWRGMMEIQCENIRAGRPIDPSVDSDLMGMYLTERYRNQYSR